MSDGQQTLILFAFTALVNGAVTWGVVSTKLAWMRRDIDDLMQRMRAVEARK